MANHDTSDTFTPDVDSKSLYEDDNIETEQAESIGIPKEERTLRTQAYDKSVNDLVAMIKSGDLILDPDYQRNYVWDRKRASLLVESIILNVPIPIIYVAEEDDGRWIVVDGLQRLESLRKFFDNEIKLGGLEIIKELERNQFSTLNPKARRILQNGILRVIVIKADSHPEIKFDIFQRLNRGAIKLNEQELRNCMYRGSLATLLKKLREYPKYLDTLGLESPDKRFADAELILRFFALKSAYNQDEQKVVGYKKMRQFLNDFMEKNRNITQDTSNELTSLFYNTVNSVVTIFSTPSFRRYIPAEGTYDRRLNRALQDAIMISFSNYDIERLILHKNRLQKLQIELSTDPKYCESLILGTSDAKKIDLRLNLWTNKLREIIS